MVTIDLKKNIGIKIYIDKNLFVKITDGNGNDLKMGEDYEITINPGIDPETVVVNLPSGISIHSNKE